MGPGSRVSVLEDPGNCCSGRRGGKKGPERQVQSEGREGAKGGVKEAKLGSSSGRLPKWQQGQSRQWVEAEPSPRERERKRVKRVPASTFLLPFPFSFFLLLKTFSPPTCPPFFLCFMSHCKCHFLGAASRDHPSLGKGPGCSL